MFLTLGVLALLLVCCGFVPAFCAILGIPPAAWDLMGCAVGYPAHELSPSIRPPIEDVAVWLA